MEPGVILFALLSQAAPVTALLNHAQKGLRIYPIVAPQGTPRPYLCYQLVSRNPEAGSSGRCRLGDVARVQLSFYADSYPVLAALTDAARAVLDYAEPQSGVYLEPDNQQDHHDKDALCLYRTLDYHVEIP